VSHNLCTGQTRSGLYSDRTVQTLGELLDAENGERLLDGPIRAVVAPMPKKTARGDYTTAVVFLVRQDWNCLDWSDNSPNEPP